MKRVREIIGEIMPPGGDLGLLHFGFFFNVSIYQSTFETNTHRATQRQTAIHSHTHLPTDHLDLTRIVEGSRRTQRELAQTQGEHVNSMHNGPSLRIELTTELLWGSSANHCATMLCFQPLAQTEFVATDVGEVLCQCPLWHHKGPTENVRTQRK